MASELKVDTIKHTNNTSAITLDTSGNVTLAGSANNIGTVSAGTFNGTVGTSATVPASVGSSMVLVKTYTDQTFDTTGVDCTDLFNSTYTNYIVRLQGVVNTTQSGLSYRLSNSSGANSSTYYWSLYSYRDSTGTARNSNGNGTNYANVTSGHKGGSSDLNLVDIEMSVNRPQINSGTTIQGQSIYSRSGTSGGINIVHGCVHMPSFQATGILFWSDTSGGSGTWQVQSYGIKIS